MKRVCLSDCTWNDDCVFSYDILRTILSRTFSQLCNDDSKGVDFEKLSRSVIDLCCTSKRVLNDPLFNNIYQRAKSWLFYKRYLNNAEPAAVLCNAPDTASMFLVLTPMINLSDKYCSFIPVCFKKKGKDWNLKHIFFVTKYYKDRLIGKMVVDTTSQIGMMI